MAVIIGPVLVACSSALAVNRHSSPHSAAPPHASCGSAMTHSLDGATQILSADPGALTCFSTAARECRPASIDVYEMGVDTGTHHVFTIDHAGTTCQVNEASQGVSFNGGGTAGPVSTTACDRTAVTDRGVALVCGGQDVLIPLTVSRI